VDNFAINIAFAVNNAIAFAFADIYWWSPSKQKSERFWPGKLVAAMGKRASELNLDTRKSKKAPRNGELLYDIGFLETNDPKHRDRLDHPRQKSSHKRVVVALRSEWNPNPDEILHNFRKLLVANSALRVFVFCARASETCNIVLNRIAAAINDFRDDSHDDVYVICAINAQKSYFTLLDSTGSIHPIFDRDNK